MPDHPRTPIRGVRVPDELWQAFLAAAHDDGETASAVIRDLMLDYVRERGYWPAAGGEE